MQSQTRPVSFRLDAHYLERLKKQASKFGMSPGEYTRRLVLDTLEESDRRRLDEGVNALQKELGQLRSDLANAVLALLVGAGKVGKEEARAWVQANLRSR